MKPAVPEWRLPRTVQCAKCPWKVGVDPHEIPRGYSVDQHRALASTIARPGDLGSVLGGQPIHVMSCHEHDASERVPCVGWLAHQLGPGNNIAMRLRMSGCANAGDIRTIGPQHERFEDTLPEDEPEYPEGEPGCPGCRGGDMVPLGAPLWRCPECGAEFEGADE